MRFRRKSAASDEVPADLPDVEETPVEAEGTEPPLDAGAGGPFDIDDIEDEVSRVDLGSLLIQPQQDRELRLQVDENTQEVQAVVLAGPDGALELRAFAAPRHGDLWTDIRPRLAADMARRGGTATEREGRFGTELVCQLGVTTQDGRTGSQQSRIVGINGSRWMLRGTFLGRPATDPDGAAEWEDALANVVVRRGEHAMPVGDALPVTMPKEARPAVPPEAQP
ncbi:MAG: DUF3710 domain-containing protein [Nocardioides sp.]